MLHGYWFGLLSVLTALLLMTGWKSTINGYVKLYLLIPLFIVVWPLSNSLEPIVLMDQADLSIHISFIVAVMLLIINEMISRSRLSVTCLVLYTLIFAMTITMLKVLMLLFPEIGMYFTDVHLALCMFIIVWLLQMNIRQIIFILCLAFALAEIMLVWQQQGNYNSVIGSLFWWDQVSISLMVSISLLLVVEQMVKIVNKLRELWLSRMKS